MRKMAQELGIAESSREMGVTLDATYRLVQAGKLPGRKDERGRWLIPAAAVQARVADRAARFAARQ